MNPRDLAKLDQAHAGMADALADFYRCLVKAGFREDQALSLVSTWMQTVLIHGLTRTPTDPDSET